MPNAFEGDYYRMLLKGSGVNLVYGSVIGFLLCSFVGGLIIYVVHKQYLKKHGIDLSLAFKEIPPE